MLESVKCPCCGGRNIIFEAQVTVRFNVDVIGTPGLISDYSNINDEIIKKRKFTGECQDCYELFLCYAKNKE